MLRTALMFWRSEWKKYLIIQTRNTEMATVRCRRGSRKSKVQIVRVPGREEIFP